MTTINPPDLPELTPAAARRADQALEYLCQYGIDIGLYEGRLRLTARKMPPRGTRSLIENYGDLIEGPATIARAMRLFVNAALAQRLGALPNSPDTDIWSPTLHNVITCRPDKGGER